MAGKKRDVPGQVPPAEGVPVEKKTADA